MTLFEQIKNQLENTDMIRNTFGLAYAINGVVQDIFVVEILTHTYEKSDIIHTLTYLKEKIELALAEFDTYMQHENDRERSYLDGRLKASNALVNVSLKIAEMK